MQILTKRKCRGGLQKSDRIDFKLKKLQDKRHFINN